MNLLCHLRWLSDTAAPCPKAQALPPTVQEHPVQILISREHGGEGGDGVGGRGASQFPLAVLRRKQHNGARVTSEDQSESRQKKRIDSRKARAGGGKLQGQLELSEVLNANSEARRGSRLHAQGLISHESPLHTRPRAFYDSAVRPLLINSYLLQRHEGAAAQLKADSGVCNLPRHHLHVRLYVQILFFGVF